MVLTEDIRARLMTVLRLARQEEFKLQDQLREAETAFLEAVQNYGSELAGDSTSEGIRMHLYRAVERRQLLEKCLDGSLSLDAEADQNDTQQQVVIEKQISDLQHKRGQLQKAVRDRALVRHFIGQIKV